MKKALLIVVGLCVAFVTFALVFASLLPESTTTAEQQPVAEVASPPVEDADTVATEAVSPSSAYSRRLHGVFVKSLTCTPNRIRLGDSIDVQIKEAWLERHWEPKPGGLFGEDDYTKGYSKDSVSEHPWLNLVIAFTPSSKLGHFDKYSWMLGEFGHYKSRLFYRTRGNRLVMNLKYYNLDSSFKYYVRYCPTKRELDCAEVTADSLLLR